MFSLWVLFRIVNAREKCWNEVLRSCTLSPISSSHHCVSAARGANDLWVVPFKWASIGSIVAINALIEKILSYCLIISLVSPTHEIVWPTLLPVCLCFVFTRMVNIIRALILVAIKLDFEIIVHHYASMTAALILIELLVFGILLFLCLLFEETWWICVADIRHSIVIVYLNNVYLTEVMASLVNTLLVPKEFSIRN